EEGRRAHAARAEAVGVGHVRSDGGLELPAVERRLELVHVEANLAGELLETRTIDALLIAEHLVVHLPELALLVRSEARLGGELRLVVEGQREVAERDADLALVVVLDLLDRWDDARAERALEVRELDDLHRRVLVADRRATAVVDLVDLVRIR